MAHPSRRRSRRDAGAFSSSVQGSVSYGNWVAGGTLVLLVVLTFSNALTAGLALDGTMLIQGDPRIRGFNLANLGLILEHSYWWPNGEAGIYRPLTTFSYLLNYSVLGNGADAAGYHWTNLLLHLLNALIVFAIVRYLFTADGRGFIKSAAVAALWAVHPAMTESVTNIAGRADLLAATGVLGGFLIYLHSRCETGWNRAKRLAGIALATALGSFSKESAVILPAVILLYEAAVPRRRQWTAAIWSCAATLPPLALILWQRAAVLGASPPAEFPFVDNPIVGAGLVSGRLTAIDVLGRYLWIALWPARLSSDYSYSQIPIVGGGLATLLKISVTLALTGIGITFIWKRSRPALFFIGFAFLTLLPTSNLLFPIGTIMAERFLYLPLLGFVFCAVLSIDTIAGRLRAGRASLPVLCCLIACSYSTRTWLRNRDWKDDLTMAKVSVVTSPGSFKTHRLLAASLFLSAPSLANIGEAASEADKSVAILSPLPDELQIPGPWSLAADCHLAKGEYEQAAHMALHSIEVDETSRTAYQRRYSFKLPTPSASGEAYRILANADLRLGRNAEALTAAARAREIDRSNAAAYAELSDAYLALHRGEDAAIALAEGMFATSDQTLRADLLRLYREGVDTSGCAVIAGPRGAALNPQCEIVHRDLCAAATRSGRQDLAAQLECKP